LHQTGEFAFSFTLHSLVFDSLIDYALPANKLAFSDFGQQAYAGSAYQMPAGSACSPASML